MHRFFSWPLSLGSSLLNTGDIRRRTYDLKPREIKYDISTNWGVQADPNMRTINDYFKKIAHDWPSLSPYRPSHPSGSIPGAQLPDGHMWQYVDAG